MEPIEGRIRLGLKTNPQIQPCFTYLLKSKPMNLESLAADIASRIPEMARDNAINNSEVIKNLIADELRRQAGRATKLLATWNSKKGVYEYKHL